VFFYCNIKRKKIKGGGFGEWRGSLFSILLPFFLAPFI